MSNVTLINQNMIAVVKTALPDYFHITNPYNLENNVGSFLNKGFAISYGSAVNDSKLISCQEFSEERSMTIFLIQLATHTDNNIECRLDLEHEIMEDALKIKKEFVKDCTLSNVVSDIQYNSDTGITYITAENETSSFDKYYSIEIDFTLKYKEIF